MLLRSMREAGVMINFIISSIQSLLGTYIFEGFALGLTFLETQLAISLFCNQLKKRYGFVIRILMMLPVCIIIVYLLAIFNTEVPSHFVRITCYLLIDLLNLLFLVICWEGRLEELLLAFSSGLAAYQVGNKFYPLLQNLNGINDRETLSLVHSGSSPIEEWEWVLFFAIRVGIYVLLALAFRPKDRLAEDKRVRRNILFVSLVTVAIVSVLVCVARVYESESTALSIVVKIFSIAFGIVVLIICAGLLTGSEKERQINILNQLMKQEKTQFESVKANMDAVNMRCHDLKHMIDKLEGKLTESEADALREATRFYDANINTGNDVMDIVLSEKAILCEKNGIRFSCMADGKPFTFLTAAQTYSLLGNIIDNAIEALHYITDPELKVISLICREQDGCPVIEESNYYVGELTFKDGIPTTRKQDSGRHGFGVRSIRYIIEQYSGILSLKTMDNMFFLEVRFPKQP